jgi:hypothetical protein
VIPEIDGTGFEFVPAAMRLRVIRVLARCRSRRDLGLDGGLDSDSAAGTLGALLVIVRLSAGCFLEIRLAAGQRIRELYRTVADALEPVATDFMLSLNRSLLSPNDGTRLRQAGIVYGSVVECSVPMRGGMQATAEAAAARHRANEQVRQCITKVQSMQTLVERVISGITQPMAKGAESKGRVESELRSRSSTEVSACGSLWRAGICLQVWLGVGAASRIMLPGIQHRESER